MRPNRQHPATALAALAFLLVTATASAEEPSSYRFSWDKIASRDDDALYRAELRKARSLIMAATETSDNDGRDKILRAADIYARAAKMRPKDPYPHYMAAEILEVFDVGRDFPSRRRQIIFHAGEFIRLAPDDPRLGEMLFTRSIEYSRNGDVESFKKAIADYERNLRLKDYTSNNQRARGDLGTTMSNAAELYMGIGDLDKAIEMYVASLEYASNTDSKTLYTYGLAVALDRDRQHIRALKLMSETFAKDHHGKQLDKPSVFFVPQGDKHYYQALGYEAVGDMRKARTYYRRFLRDLPNSQYAEAARENLKGLGKVSDKPQPRIHGPLEF